MNIQQLRESVKIKWVNYYQQNRSWLTKMKVWADYDGVRRPLSSFILATLSVLEPEFDHTLSFIMDLNNNPDDIVAALGLNFNPDEEKLNTKSSKELITNKPINNRPQNHYRPAAEIISKLPVTNQAAVPILSTTVNSKLTSVCPHVASQISPIRKIHSGLPSQHKPASNLSIQLSSQGKNLSYCHRQAQEIIGTVGISFKTHASTLASWVDEYCQGKR